MPADHKVLVLQLKDVKFELEGLRLLGSDTARGRNIQNGLAIQVASVDVPGQAEAEAQMLMCKEAMQSD